MSHIPEDVRPPCVSAQCRIRVQCLREALSAPGIVLGIWGGTTEYERRSICRARAS